MGPKSILGINGSSQAIDQITLYHGLPIFVSTNLKNKIEGDYDVLGRVGRVARVTGSLFKKIGKACRTTTTPVLGSISRSLVTVGNIPCLVEGALLPLSICDIGKGFVGMIEQVSVCKSGEGLKDSHKIIQIKDKDKFADSGVLFIENIGATFSRITGPCEALAVFGVSALEGIKWIPGLNMATTALSIIPLTYKTVNFFKSHNLLKDINRRLSATDSESENVKATMAFFAGKSEMWLKIRGVSSWYKKSLVEVDNLIKSADPKEQLIGCVKGKILLENIKSRIKKHRRIGGLSLLVSVVCLVMFGIISFIGITNPIGLLILGVASLMTAIAGISILIYKTRVLRDPMDPTMVRAMSGDPTYQREALQKVVKSAYATIIEGMSERSVTQDESCEFKSFYPKAITEAEEYNVERLNKVLSDIKETEKSKQLPKGRVMRRFAESGKKVVAFLNRMPHSEDLCSIGSGSALPLFKLE